MYEYDEVTDAVTVEIAGRDIMGFPLAGGLAGSEPGVVKDVEDQLLLEDALVRANEFD